MAKVFPITKTRYLNYIKLRARQVAPRLIDWPEQFTPFSLERTDMDSCVLSNGPTRCGTNLVNSLIVGLDHWQHIGVRIDREHYEIRAPDGKTSFYYCSWDSAAKKLRNGQKVHGHLPWSRALEKSLNQVMPNRRFKHLFIYRDPRDAMVSGWRQDFYPEMIPGQSETTEERNRWRKSFANDDERLTYTLKHPQYYTFPQYEPWLHSPNCFPVKFEDLYPEIVALQHNGLGPVLRRILDYLELDASDVRPEDLYHKVYGKSLNFSTEKDKVGQYKRVFKDQHYALIDTPEFRNILNVFGYEW